MNRYSLGVDLGQVSDPTAISILDERLEKREIQTPEDLVIRGPGKNIFFRTYQLRHLERPVLGTSYPDIRRGVKELITNPILAGQTDLIVDATGVGRPVIDEMREDGLNPIPVVITFGLAGRDIVQDEFGYFRVPKIEIMSSLQVLFGSKRLQYPPHLISPTQEDLVPVFLQEMERFKMKRTKAGNMTYEAWRETDRDDIVLSIAIQCWWILFSRPKEETFGVEEPEEEYNPHQVMRSVLDNHRRR